MAFTRFQHEICQIIRDRLQGSEDSYLAGGAALNQVIGAPRISRDFDLFHDTMTAVDSAFHEDMASFLRHKLTVSILRDVPGFKEAIIKGKEEQLLIQWTRDSAFRFFPLVTDDVLGMTLHPFDLATNKVLALVGRLEPRDWIDVHECDARIQPLGYLAWAACAKDPGFSPVSIVTEARRGGHYSQLELNELAFSGGAPDAGILGRNWHRMLDRAEKIIEALLAFESGDCVLDGPDTLCCLSPDELSEALRGKRIHFRSGSIRGVLPVIRPV